MDELDQLAHALAQRFKVDDNTGKELLRTIDLVGPRVVLTFVAAIKETGDRLARS